MKDQLEIRDIRKDFGKRNVLSKASLTAESGEMVGIVGENGSGKSTFLRILSGVIRSDAGEMLWNDSDLLHSPKLLSKLVSYVPQGTPLIEELTVKDNLSLWYRRDALHASLGNGRLAELGIGAFLNIRADRLSGGMRKRLVIGCALARSPKVLLLDEPTVALDVSAKEIVLSFFRRFCDDGGIILIATHALLCFRRDPCLPSR